ncbi:Alpha-tocopherol transfer protein [Portunus trituberculatus]|uniref:Alpha-tocopherol transfer protein n=1 Tax=Portunus trituberculatus TaxID=210409 RepID=A0A5B7DZC7_PORTR|nr:Alpha-tocopherol transfer protein [Portunus trituberculatus]
MGRKVLFCRWGIYDPKEVTMDELIKSTSMIMDVLMDEDEQTSLVGINMLGDCEGLTFSHAVAFTPAHAKKSMVMWQDEHPTFSFHSVALLLPGCDHQGRRIILSRPGVFDPSTTSIDELSKTMMLLCDIFMEEDETLSVTGMVMVEDFKNFSLSHLAALSPVTVKKMTTLFQV